MKNTEITDDIKDVKVTLEDRGKQKKNEISSHKQKISAPSAKRKTKEGPRRSKSLPSPDEKQKPSDKQMKNSLVTDFFPVRRSSRMPASMKQKEKQQEFVDAILDKKEDGLKVVEIEGKGRGVVATQVFKQGDFIIEYAGELLNESKASQREEEYEKTPSVGCYMYYFIHAGKRYCVDATAETPRLGRLINHSKSQPNCVTRVIPIDDTPHLILVASRDIKSGEELLYDYGDRSRSSLESHPWLAL